MLKGNRKPLTFEALESRNLLAVTAAVVDGDLLINGDAASETLTVTNTAPGQYTLAGALNGVFNGVTDDVCINMGGGTDNLTIGSGGANHFFPDELKVRMGGGADTLALLRVFVSDDTDLFTNGGADIVFIAGSSFEEFDLNVNSGDDNVTITSSGAIRSRFADDTNILLGDGTNFLAINFSDFLDDVEIDGGNNGDSISVFSSFFDDEVEIDLFAGDDVVTSTASVYNEDVEIDGGFGTDTVTDGGGNAFNDELELESVEVFNPGGSFFDEIEFEDD